MPATRRAALAAVAAIALPLAGCTTVPEPGAPNFGGIPPTRLAVASVDVQSQVQNLPTQFIDLRRTDGLVAATKAFLAQRVQATGGSDTARAVIEQASLVEQHGAGQGVAGASTGGPRRASRGRSPAGGCSSWACCRCGSRWWTARASRRPTAAPGST